MTKIKFLLIILFCGVITINSFSSASLAEEVSIITEEEAISIFLDNSYTTQKIELENQILMINYEDSKDSLEEQLDDLEDSKEDYEEAKEEDSDDEDELKEEYYSQASKYATQEKQFILVEYDINVMEEQKEFDIEQEVNDLKKQLYDYYLLKEQLKLMDENINLAKQELEFEQVKYEKGNSSEKDLKEKQYNYEDLLIQRDSILNSIDLALEELKIILSIPLDQDVDFEISLDEPNVSENLSLVNMLDYYKNNNLSYLRKVLELDALEEYVEYLQQVYLSTNEDYLEAYYNYQIDKINIQESMTTSINSFINNYHSLLSQNNTLSRKEDNIELAKIEYDNKLKEYNSGQISAYERDKAEYTYNQANYEYEKSIIELDNKLMDFLLLTQY